MENETLETTGLKTPKKAAAKAPQEKAAGEPELVEKTLTRPAVGEIEGSVGDVVRVTAEQAEAHAHLFEEQDGDGDPYAGDIEVVLAQACSRGGVRGKAGDVMKVNKKFIKDKPHLILEAGSPMHETAKEIIRVLGD